MEFRVRKNDAGLLEPFDQEAADIISKWKQGDFVLVNAKRPRSYEHHKRYFALLNILLEETEIFNDIEEAQTYFKIKAGIYKTVEIDGKFYPMVGSINFSQMNEDAFGIFFNKAVQIALNVLPVDEVELADKIARF